MTKVDQFESMFRAAAREVFELKPVEIASVLVVTDRERAAADAFARRVRNFLGVIGEEGVGWRVVVGSEVQTAADLLELVESTAPGLICTYRNLHSTAWKWPYSLGTHLDLLTQHTKVPVIVLPHPDAQRSAAHAMQRTSTVMAITDQLAGDQRLVNHAARFTASGGTLWLTHVEDEITFERYIALIGRIPAIDTDSARELLADQLLKEPRAYIESCRDVLQKAGLPIKVEALVRFGQYLSEYRRLIEEHQVDLLVVNTQDEGQLAMRGIAYELAVELRHIPLLML